MVIDNKGSRLAQPRSLAGQVMVAPEMGCSVGQESRRKGRAGNKSRWSRQGVGRGGSRDGSTRIPEEGGS